MGRFSGAVDFPAPPSVTAAAGAEAAPAATAAAATGLIINEIAQGDPLDWVELYNASDSYVALANFVLADDLTDASKRVLRAPDLVIAPGAYLRIELDKDGWPGFALGKDDRPHPDHAHSHPGSSQPRRNGGRTVAPTPILHPDGRATTSRIVSTRRDSPMIHIDELCRNDNHIVVRKEWTWLKTVSQPTSPG